MSRSKWWYHESDVQLETIQLFLSFEKLIQKTIFQLMSRKKPSTDVPKSFEERQIFQRTHQPDVEKTSRSHHEVSWEELKKEEKKQVTARKLRGFHGKFGSENGRYICITPLKNHHDPEIYLIFRSTHFWILFFSYVPWSSYMLDTFLFLCPQRWWEDLTPTSKGSKSIGKDTVFWSNVRWL